MTHGKTVVIAQYFGLGDIIWGQAIADIFFRKGYSVVWPVLPQLVEGLTRAYPNISFVDYSQYNIDYTNKSYAEIDSVLHLPMRYSEHLMGKPYKFHMVSKYSFLGLDWRIWKNQVMKRSSVKEIELMNILGVADGSEYCLIATEFGNKGNKIDIHVHDDIKKVELKVVPGYSLFDWCMVIERASYIHAVSSSTLYLFELLNLSAKEIHLYPRKPIEQNFDYVSFLFTKDYILHE